MAKLNNINISITADGIKIRHDLDKDPNITINSAGGEAFNISTKEKLISAVLSSFWAEPKYYETRLNGKEVTGTTNDSNCSLISQTIFELSQSNDPEFILKLAAFARNEMNMRTTPIVMLVEASLYPGSKPFVRAWTPHIIKRADEILEALSYLRCRIGHIGNKAQKGSMPKCLQRGLADTFFNFSPYQFAKYSGGSNKLFTFKDAVKVIHPRARGGEHHVLLNDILSETLEPANTWETTISNWQGNFNSKDSAWKHVLTELWFKKDGTKGLNNYMAALRNVKNVLEQTKMSDPFKIELLNRLSNKENIKNSKQLPFRFYSAQKEIPSGLPLSNKANQSISDCLEYSIENTPSIDGDIFIALDHSGSMDQPISNKSKVNLKEIADLFTAMAIKKAKGEVHVCAFASEIFIHSLNRRDSITSLIKELKSVDVGSSTEAEKSVAWLNQNNIRVDKILIFSDMQTYTADSGRDISLMQMYLGVNHKLNQSKTKTLAEEIQLYRQNINPHVKVFSIDLAGYGQISMPKKDNVYLLNGWSEKIFDFLDLADKKSTEQLEIIDNYEPDYNFNRFNLGKSNNNNNSRIKKEDNNLDDD
jgi:hypothetical protein